LPREGKKNGSGKGEKEKLGEGGSKRGHCAKKERKDMGEMLPAEAQKRSITLVRNWSSPYHLYKNKGRRGKPQTRRKGGEGSPQKVSRRLRKKFEEKNPRPPSSLSTLSLSRMANYF